MQCTFFSSFLCLMSCCVLSLSLSLSLSCLVFFSWNLRNLSLLRTRYVVIPFPPSLLILFSSVMKRHEMNYLRTFLIGWFIWNARSFCLTFQTFFYLVCLAPRARLLYVRKRRGVPMRSYKSFTPTCTPPIPLYLGLL